MYCVYFVILAVAYFVGAAVVLVRHYRNQRGGDGAGGGGGGGGGTNEAATLTELHPVAAQSSEAEILSNGKNAKV